MSDRPPPALSDPQRRRLRKLAAIPVGLALLVYVGQILAGALLDTAPLVLLSLNATDPVLLLVAHDAPFLGFLLVGTVRLFAPDLLLHQIGREFGPQTQQLLDAELGPGNRVNRAINWLERWFPRVGWLLLFALPGYPMCLLSGIVAMNRVWFVVVNLAGTITRVSLIYWVSSLFEGPVGTVVGAINRYSLPFTVLMVVLVIGQTRRTQGGRPSRGSSPGTPPAD